MTSSLVNGAVVSVDRKNALACWDDATGRRTFEEEAATRANRDAVRDARRVIVAIGTSIVSRFGERARELHSSYSWWHKRFLCWRCVGVQLSVSMFCHRCRPLACLKNCVHRSKKYVCIVFSKIKNNIIFDLWRRQEIKDLVSPTPSFYSYVFFGGGGRLRL